MTTNRKAIEQLTMVFGFGYSHVFSEITDSVRKMHISKEQMAIIEYLYKNNEATPSQMSTALNVHKSSIAHALKKLSLKKLIKTKENQLTNDKRSKLISLTPKALDLLEDVIDNIQAVIHTHLKDISEEENQALIEAAGTIIKIMNIDGGSPNEIRT